MIEQLRKQFPHSAIVNTPLPDCPVCRGQGTRLNRLNQLRPCLCIHLSGTDDRERHKAVSAFKQAAARISEELKQCPN